MEAKIISTQLTGFRNKAYSIGLTHILVYMNPNITIGEVDDKNS